MCVLSHLQVLCVLHLKGKILDTGSLLLRDFSFSRKHQVRTERFVNASVRIQSLDLSGSAGKSRTNSNILRPKLLCSVGEHQSST